MFGQALVVASHRPYYLQTTNPNAILGSFLTIVNTDDGSKQSHAASMINGFINEFIGSFVLFFCSNGHDQKLFWCRSYQIRC